MRELQNQVAVHQQAAREVQVQAQQFEQRMQAQLTEELYLGYISAISRLHLGCISAVSRLYLGCISAASRLYLGYISAVSRLYLGAARMGAHIVPALVVAPDFFAKRRGAPRSEI